MCILGLILISRKDRQADRINLEVGLSILFLIINLQGDSNMKVVKAVFDTSSCEQGKQVCDVGVTFENFEGPVLVYLKLDNYFLG